MHPALFSAVDFSALSPLGKAWFSSVPYCPRFELGAYDTLDAGWKRGILGGLVETLVLADRAFLRARPDTPPLYQAGVRYVFNRDRWQDIPTMLRRREGDCKDLTAWRVAELRREGIRAAVHVTEREIPQPSGLVHMYHVLVRFPDGRLEDPSRMLGMGDPWAVMNHPQGQVPGPGMPIGGPPPLQVSGFGRRQGRPGPGPGLARGMPLPPVPQAAAGAYFPRFR